MAIDLQTLKQEIELLKKVSHEQKGELLYLHTFVITLLQSMPDKGIELFNLQFPINCEKARNAALYSSADDETMQAFEHYVAHGIRRDQTDV
jgi:hypothetical protein